MHAMRRPVAFVMLFALVAAGASWAGAQQLESDKDLNDAKRNASGTFLKLRNGEKEPTKGDQKALDAMAKYFVYRFASSTVKTWEDMAKLRTEMVNYQINFALAPDPYKKNGKFRQQFGASLASAYRTFFEGNFADYRFQIVNLAPTLVDAARMRSDAFADYLAEVITDPETSKGSKATKQHDVVKLYAIRGLREYYAAGEKGTIYDKVQQARPIVPREAGTGLADADQKKMERDQRYVDALLKFAENKPGATKRLAEEQEAIRFLRREAIETLAATQAPLVVYSKKTAEGAIAPFLLRVLSPKSDLEPAPSMAEKVEAAIGVCRMKYDKVEAYQPELGVYLVGQFLGDFMTEANKDVGPVSTNKKPAWMHWRTDAKRLELALKDMVTYAKNHPVKTNVGKLESGAAPILRDIAKGRTVSGGKVVLEQVNQGQLNQFRKMAVTLRPKTNQVFKDMPQYKLDLGE